MRVIRHLALLSLMARAATATTLQPLDMAELSEAAQVVVHGQVVEQACRWSRDGQRIETVVTVEVMTRIRGEAGRETSFAVPGGRIGHEVGQVDGTPRFAVGEEVVVFLDVRGPDPPQLVGLGQGVLRVFVAEGRRMVLAPRTEPLRPGALRTEFVRRAPLPLETLAGQLAQPARAVKSPRAGR
jgi:hypothetical protein